MNPLRNPKDPLRAQPDAERELFGAMGQLATGHTHSQVVNVAANLLVNSVRQKCATKREAEDEFNKIVTRAREVLLDKHYDQMGKRRNVYPFDQVIAMPMSDLRG